MRGNSFQSLCLEGEYAHSLHHKYWFSSGRDTFGTALVWLTVRLIVARIHAQQIGAHISLLVVHIGALKLLVMVLIFVTVFLLTWRRH